MTGDRRDDVCYCHPDLPIGVDFWCRAVRYRLSPGMVALALCHVADDLEGGVAGARYPVLQSVFHRDGFGRSGARRLLQELDGIEPSCDWPKPAIGILRLLKQLASESVRTGAAIDILHTG